MIKNNGEVKTEKEEGGSYSVRIQSKRLNTYRQNIQKDL